MSLPVLSPAELKLVEEAMELDDEDCGSWTKYCGAECCKSFRVKNYGQDLSVKELAVHTLLSQDMQYYYKLHGIRYGHGVLYVPTSWIKKDKDWLNVSARCKMLTEDNKCSAHGTEKQPNFCKGFNMAGIRANMVQGALITPNCMFRYKVLGETAIMEAEQNGDE